MKATITDDFGHDVACEPLAGQGGAGGGGGHLFPHWYTLLILPVTLTTGSTTPATNCSDGGGGTADCHDNAIMFSCCALITPDDDTTAHTVKIKLADLPGGDANFAFYERSTIYIDGSPNPGDKLCKGHGFPGS